MIRRLACVAGAMLASAVPAHAAEAGGCGVSLVASWSPAAGKTYRVAAASTGSDCAIANVSLTIRAASGAALLTFASAAADLPLPFDGVATPPAMQAAPRRWIAQPRARTTRELPAWSAQNDEPGGADVVFHPEPSISRSHYAELRKWGQPMFCFVQGSESEACYALDSRKGDLTLIGTLMLPG